MTRLEKLQQLVEMSPDDPLAHYAVALELFNQERFDEAIGAFAKTLATDANYAAAYYHKARAEIRAGHKAQAAETLQSGMRVAEANGDAKTVREMQELLETIS